MGSVQKHLALLPIFCLSFSVFAQLSIEDSFSERNYTSDNGDYTAPRTDLLRSSVGDFIYGPNSKLEFKIIEDESGVKTTYYKIGSLPYTKSYGDKLLPVRLEDGGYRILYYSVDQSGNQEQLRFDDIFVDKTGPEILYSFSELPEQFDESGLPVYSESSRLRIEVVDRRVDVKKVEYQVNGQNTIVANGTTLDLKLKAIQADAPVIQLSLYAEDEFGNISEEVITYRISD